LGSLSLCRRFYPGRSETGLTLENVYYPLLPPGENPVGAFSNSSQPKVRDLSFLESSIEQVRIKMKPLRFDIIFGQD
jgi:hypothetical protein